MLGFLLLLPEHFSGRNSGTCLFLAPMGRLLAQLGAEFGVGASCDEGSFTPLAIASHVAVSVVMDGTQQAAQAVLQEMEYLVIRKFSSSTAYVYEAQTVRVTSSSSPPPPRTESHAFAFIDYVIVRVQVIARNIQAPVSPPGCIKR